MIILCVGFPLFKLFKAFKKISYFMFWFQLNIQKSKIKYIHNHLNIWDIFNWTL